MKGVIEEVKNKVLLVFQSQQYCDKWISEDYLFDVLKFNYHYSGKKQTMNRAMSSLKVDYPFMININPKYISNKKISFYYVSLTGVIPNTSSMLQSDWESIHEYKRITRVNTSNQSAPVIKGTLEPEQCTKSKDSFNEIKDSQKITVPQFTKNYAIMTSSTIDSKKSRSSTIGSLRKSTFGIITPSPKKKKSSNVFTTQKHSIINVTNLDLCNNDEIFDQFFESTEMRNLFCPSIDESVQESIVNRISILDDIIESKDGIKKYVEHTKKHPLTTQQVQSLTVLCTALRASYYFALNHMAVEKNWSIVITKALQVYVSVA